MYRQSLGASPKLYTGRTKLMGHMSGCRRIDEEMEKLPVKLLCLTRKHTHSLLALPTMLTNYG